MKNPRAVDSSPASGQVANQLIAGCRHCITQCEQLLGLLYQESFVSKSEATSSIGAHMRHILDRYHCFFAGLQSGVIDYDERKRDKSIETNLEAASFALTSVSRRIECLDLTEVLGRTAEVRETVHPESPLAEIPSTFDRELMGLISHSTHHLAIIALIAKSLGYEIDDDFGKAPSTIVYERS
ncbi:MAG: DinB family protein [Pseudomonadales bacterium]|nr:DinB family protein [Pseudomonadales bacterium]